MIRQKSAALVSDGKYASECDIGYAYGCEDCAAAIRALNAPAAP